MLETSWLWFVISKEYVELTRPKIESRDPIFFTGTRSRSRVSGNDRLFPRGSEFGPNLEIPAGPAIQLRPGPVHSGETDEANCSWLHPVWPPPKRPDQDSTFCAVNKASTELIFCIHRDFDVRNVCKPRRLVWEYCRDISAWKLRVMKPTVFRDAGRMKPTEYRDEANWFSNWADYANCW